MLVMNEDQYRKLVYDVADLIKAELFKLNLLSDLEGKDIVQGYVQGIVMLEFFRFLRGDAFIDTEVRPHTPGFQKNYYGLEDEISTKLKKLKNKVDLEKEADRIDQYFKEVIHNWIQTNQSGSKKDEGGDKTS